MDTQVRQEQAEETGYLEQEYRLFHLRDQIEREYASHYHTFHKVIFFLEGNVTYHIEGKAYVLQPGDLLLVSKYDIHRPEIDPSVPYDRYILWIREDLAEQQLTHCFERAREQRFQLMRLAERRREIFRALFHELYRAEKQDAFGAEILRDSLFRQLMVYLNRAFLGKQYLVEEGMYHEDAQIEEVLRYINSHLEGDLSVDALAQQCYLSRYYLMRKFRAATGYTIHSYVTNKRLLMARMLLDQGEPVGKTAERCGFLDYSTFVRAYRKQFHETPSQTSRAAQNPFRFEAENRE